MNLRLLPTPLCVSLSHGGHYIAHLVQPTQSANLVLSFLITFVLGCCCFCDGLDWNLKKYISISFKNNDRWEKGNSIKSLSCVILHHQSTSRDCLSAGAVTWPTFPSANQFVQGIKGVWVGGGRFVVPFCERVQIELIVITTLLSLQSFRIGGLLPPLYPVMPHNGPTTLSLCRSSLLSVGWAKGEGLVTYRVAVGQCSISRSLSLFIFDVYIPGGLSGSVGARASGSKTNVLDVVQQSTRGGGEEQTWKLCHI